MTRDEAHAALAQRYRLRLVVEVIHEDHYAIVPASTMADTQTGLLTVAADLFAGALTLALQRLEEELRHD